MNLWILLGIPALLIVAFIVHRFVGYKLEADADDRYEGDDE